MFCGGSAERGAYITLSCRPPTRPSLSQCYDLRSRHKKKTFHPSFNLPMHQPNHPSFIDGTTSVFHRQSGGGSLYRHLYRPYVGIDIYINLESGSIKIENNTNIDTGIDLNIDTGIDVNIEISCIPIYQFPLSYQHHDRHRHQHTTWDSGTENQRRCHQHHRRSRLSMQNK